MITYIKINGFKSFHNFEMDFMPLTVIAGSNAAGKSNLFDALKLLASLADTDKIQKAFREQRGELSELFTQYDDHTFAKDMSFIVEMLVNPYITDTWGSTEKLRYTRLRYELTLRRFTNSIGMEDIEVINEKLDTIKHDKDKWIKILPAQTAETWRPKVITGRRQIPYIYTDLYNGKNTIIVPQDGSQGKKRLFPFVRDIIFFLWYQVAFFYCSDGLKRIQHPLSTCTSMKKSCSPLFLFSFIFWELADFL